MGLLQQKRKSTRSSIRPSISIIKREMGRKEEHKEQGAEGERGGQGERGGEGERGGQGERGGGVGGGGLILLCE